MYDFTVLTAIKRRKSGENTHSGYVVALIETRAAGTRNQTGSRYRGDRAARCCKQIMNKVGDRERGSCKETHGAIDGRKVTVRH